MDAGNMAKPLFARGQLRLIGATMLDEYRHHIDSDAALEDGSQVFGGEPTLVEQGHASCLRSAFISRNVGIVTKGTAELGHRDFTCLGRATRVTQRGNRASGNHAKKPTTAVGGSAGAGARELETEAKAAGRHEHCCWRRSAGARPGSGRRYRASWRESRTVGRCAAGGSSRIDAPAPIAADR